MSSNRFWLGLVLVMIGFIFLVPAIYESNVETKLVRDGVKTDATLVDKQERKGRKGRKEYRIELRFQDADSQDHTLVHSGSKLWSKAIGEKVPIVYLRTDPRTSRLAGEAKAKGFFIGGLIAMVIGLVLSVPPLLTARRTPSAAIG